MIKSVIVQKEPKPAKSKYPYIGQSVKNPDVIVLFRTPGAGTALTSTENCPLGIMITDWEEARFKPLEGDIVLSND